MSSAPAPELLEVRSPFDGRLLAELPLQGVREVDEAVRRAVGALAVEHPAHERAAVLDRMAGALEHRADEFARTIALEAAKPVTTAADEVARAVSTLLFSAAVARTHAGVGLPLDASAAGTGKLGFTVRTPVGVVAAITPFNFPLNLVVHKVGPALAVGCPVVVKPAEATPMTALLLRELALSCGVPPDRFQVVTGLGATCGARLVDHPDVAMVTFTGSPSVGWGLRARAPRKRVSLELGNNAPLIVAADGDAGRAARAVRSAGYGFSGQSCISTQRVLVHRSRYAEFVDDLAEHVATLRTGDPLDPGTELSALIRPTETERVSSWVGEAVAAGARLVAGGGRAGTVLEPVVLADVRPEMRVSRSEVFGPVVGVAPFDDLDEAIASANDSSYGLQASVFTRSLDTALRAAHRLDFGGVLVNEVPTWRADQQPYGGKRDSGNTREGPAWTAEDMTEIKTIIFDGWGT